MGWRKYLCNKRNCEENIKFIPFTSKLKLSNDRLNVDWGFFRSDSWLVASNFPNWHKNEIYCRQRKTITVNFPSISWACKSSRAVTGVKWTHNHNAIRKGGCGSLHTSVAFYGQCMRQEFHMQMTEIEHTRPLAPDHCGQSRRQSGANPSSASSELFPSMNSSELAEFQTYSRNISASLRRRG